VFPKYLESLYCPHFNKQKINKVKMERSRAAALLLLLALLVAVCSAGTGASRISIVNDAADESVAIQPAFDYPWAGFRSLFSVSGFQQAANDLRSIVENAISHIRIDKIVRS
jgi:hypothetical protein